MLPQPESILPGSQSRDSFLHLQIFYSKFLKVSVGSGLSRSTDERSSLKSVTGMKNITGFLSQVLDANKRLRCGM